MADKRLDANILLRYDRYTRLMGSSIILQPGEAAVAAFPSPNQGEPPIAFGIKVGDGQRYFDELPWIQALAADVYEWAKDPYKPVYQATEIVGLAEYIAAHTSGGGGGGSGSSSTYRIIYDSASSKYILQQWNETENDWENTASEINLSDILNRIDTIERWANGARTKLGNIEMPLAAYVYEEVVNQLSHLNYNDNAVEGQFVTSVDQIEGNIEVTRAPINMSEITEGILPTAHGGTGVSSVYEDEILIGSNSGELVKSSLVSSIDDDRNSIATTGAIIDYVNEKTAGLTGAMHFIGETAVIINDTTNNAANPQIRGYDFSKAQPGDVILANGYQEYVWTGTNWRLLGDEGSYAIKGSITNADIAEGAEIDQSKIANLANTLDEKVDKVEGKQLSTNDYNNDEKEKLNTIYEGDWENTINHILVNGTEVSPTEEKAVDLTIPELTEEQIEAINNWQPNPIDHIFINGTEVEPSTYKNTPKSINIEYVLTEGEKEKLNGIETGAQVNTIETIIINGTEYSGNNNKQVSITIDQAALNLNVLEGARYPSGTNQYTDIDITNKKLELSKVAATGNIDDLIQNSGSYIILNCGSSTEVI